MDSKKIILLSNQNDRSNELVSTLKSKDLFVSTVKNIDQATSRLTTSDIFMILIDYISIKEAERNDLKILFANSSTTKFVIYDVPDDATRRRAFYRLGTYRILPKNYNIEDIVFFCSNAMKKVETNGKLKEAHFSGTLEDFQLTGLISIFGRERRSGILRIRTNGSTGKIYFDEGNIIHAISGNLRGDDAVFYMLTWDKGWFSMRPLPLAVSENYIQLSNLGLILQGEQISLKFKEHINELGGTGRQLRVINQGDILQASLKTEFQDFIKHLAEFRKIHEIIEFSPYPMIETLTILQGLRKSKNLEFRETVSGIGEIYVEKTQQKVEQTEYLLKENEVKKLRKVLNAKDLTSGKLLILGSNTCGKTDFIRNFNQGSHSGVRTNQDLDFTRIDLATNFHLQVFGIVFDKRLMNIVEKLSEGLLGYIFLIDAEKPNELEYTNYIINHLTSIFDVPWTIALTNIDTKDSNLLKKIKSSLRIPDGRELHICDVTNIDDVRKIILSMATMNK
jgi:signal recognition particle receptor subunit beta